MLLRLMNSMWNMAGRNLPVENGDPVNTISGALVDRQTDLSSLGGLGIPLDFQRFYSSALHSRSSVLGYGWSHSYNIRFSIGSDWARSFGTRAALEAAPALAAAQIGLEVLRTGGGAVDAAVAAAAAVAVLRPHMSGLGGDAFILVYDPDRRSVATLNGSGRAVAAATPEALAARGHRTRVPMQGPHVATLTVPGALAAWADLLDRFGMAPRINYEVVAPFLRPVPGMGVAVTMQTQLFASGPNYGNHPSIEPLKRGNGFVSALAALACASWMTQDAAFPAQRSMSTA